MECEDHAGEDEADVGRHAEMKRRYEVAMTALCSIEGQIEATLNAQGVHASLYVPYLLV